MHWAGSGVFHGSNGGFVDVQFFSGLDGGRGRAPVSRTSVARVGRIAAMSDANVIIGVDVFFLQQSFFFGMMTVALILVQILFGIVTYGVIIIFVSYFLKRIGFAAT